MHEVETPEKTIIGGIDVEETLNGVWCMSTVLRILEDERYPGKGSGKLRKSFDQIRNHKEDIFAALTQERPELYRQLVTYIKEKETSE